ncbi:hypothetical protein CEXT_712101 [Caerostris extrusa]|uniref:Uncharacterized protein n=1 Tax=Caerostris extrusa TaxID=172846 RepID=A0AAV4QRN9_CAEEX|nr:hypothetical protein CEXT_712101 [Caerostris extrusa]
MGVQSFIVRNLCLTSHICSGIYLRGFIVRICFENETIAEERYPSDTSEIPPGTNPKGTRSKKIARYIINPSLGKLFHHLQRTLGFQESVKKRKVNRSFHKGGHASCSFDCLRDSDRKVPGK